MTPAEATSAALLLDNVKELESFLGKHKADDSRPVYLTGMRGRTDTNVLSLKFQPEDVEDLLRPLATAMRVRLEDMGIA
jgi:hypothetical protein